MIRWQRSIMLLCENVISIPTPGFLKDKRVSSFHKARHPFVFRIWQRVKDSNCAGMVLGCRTLCHRIPADTAIQSLLENMISNSIGPY